MIGCTPVWSVLLAFSVVLMENSGCHSYQMRANYPEINDFQDHQIFRRAHLKDDDDSVAFPKVHSDFFGPDSAESSDHRRREMEKDSSISMDENSVVGIPFEHTSQVVKRRKGPTLSVVNPLEILRQRLMLDLARRRIHENQQQIVANAQLLENIGKRSLSPVHRRQDSYKDDNYQD